MSSQHTYTYQDIPSKLRARLAHSLSDPACLAGTDALDDRMFYGLHGAGALLTLWLIKVLLASDYGSPFSASGWDDHGIIVVYVLLAAALALLVLRCVRRYRLTRLFGFRPGRYVLPFTIVDARSTAIGVSDLLQLKALNITHYTTNGNYTKSMLSFTMHDGKLHLFTVHKKLRAERFYERVHTLQAEARQAFQARDLDTLKRFDPLVELRQNKWAMPAGRRITPPPATWQRLLHNQALAAVLAALVAGPAAWALRTAANDGAMYRQTLAAKSEQASLGYLARGRFHAAEVRAALPRIAFDEAARKQSVTALREVLKRYPDGGLEQDVAAGIHAQYERSLERFLAQATRTDPVLVDAMRDLLAQAEAHGNPRLRVRFVRPSIEQLAELDRALERRGAVDGRHIIPASQYFSNASAGVRESRIVAGMQRAFQTIFPHDVLKLESGAPGKGQPVLDIHYEIEPSGILYYSQRDASRGFVGLRVRFDSALVASETAAPWRFRLDVKPPEHFTVQYKDGGIGSHGPEDGQVYAVMAERAFDSLDGAIRAAFFRPDSDIMLRQAKQGLARPAALTPGSAPARASARSAI